MGQREPRKYQVPEGLADKVCHFDDMAVDSRLFQRKLWKLLEDRCPETKDGHWRLSFEGSRIFIEEVMA